MDRMPSQIISLEGEKYALPQENLKELVRIPAHEIKNKIDKVGSMPVVRLRDEFLPLVDLADVLGVQKTYVTESGESNIDRREQIADRRSVQHLQQGEETPFESEKPFIERQKDDRRSSVSSALKLAIVHSDEYRYGLVLDQFCEPEEVEVLPAGRYLSPAGIYAGAAILRDESPVLVLDILEIAHKSNLSAACETVNDVITDSIADEDSNLEEFSLLTFRNLSTEYFAADLGYVDRLERIKNESFEQIGKQRVVQYRGGALPVVELSQFVNCSQLEPSDVWEVVVFEYEGFLAGLKVRPPVDTIECRLALDRSTFNTPPVNGTVTLNHKTTLLLDVPAMINMIQRRSAS